MPSIVRSGHGGSVGRGPCSGEFEGSALDRVAGVARPTIGVVSYFAHHPWGPRGLRTRAVVEALEPSWDVMAVYGPHSDFTRPTGRVARVSSFAGYKIHEAVGIDLHEAWSRRHVRRWTRRPDLVLAIGYPFSPAVEAARALPAADVPIVVDMSDPWVLTAPEPAMGKVALLRARRAEERLWRAAAGAILTTRRQQRALSARFPHLRTLVRPNGYQVIRTPPLAPSVHRPEGELRIGHFGNLYYPRVGLGPFLSRLAGSGLWRSITFEQFGNDWNDTLSRVPSGVRVRMHPPLPWRDVLELAHRKLDLAVVVGNVDPAQMPSKVVEYLTLPIPRLALVPPPGDDAITDYVADKPGWVAVCAEDSDVASTVRAHVEREWNPEELRPPPGEAWPAVGREIAEFLPGFLRHDRSPLRRDGAATGPGATGLVEEVR